MEPDFIAKIVELFETIDNEPYFTAQWFYRAKDTVINFLLYYLFLQFIIYLLFSFAKSYMLSFY